MSRVLVSQSSPLFLRRAVLQKPFLSVKNLSFTSGKRGTPQHRIPILKSNFFGTTALTVVGLCVLAYSLDARSAINEYVYCPLIRRVTDAEQGHKLGVFLMKYGLSPRLFNDKDDKVLEVSVFDKKLANPIGMAAGFDKHGECIDALFDLGFSYVEIGSITPEPQPGNPEPRFFRLPKDEAVINRYGFNSVGHWDVLGRLKLRAEKYLRAEAVAASSLDQSLKDNHVTTNAFRNNKLLAINLGKNKNGDEIEDYVKGVERFGPFADVLVINVSSPNTPGLRNLQSSDKLTNLLKIVVNQRDLLNGNLLHSKPPILVKIAPDLTEIEIKSIAESAKEAKIDGIIMSNTTIQRDNLKLLTTDKNLINEQGGLSGAPLKEISLNAFKKLRKYTKDSDLVLIGCGGISNGKDAIEFAKAGATFVQLYTAFAYKGPGLAAKIKDEITSELKKENKTWMEIIGADDNEK